MPMEWWALETKGVENWTGLDVAIAFAKDDGYDFNELDDEDKLYYAQFANIQNWEGYKRAQHLIDIYPSVVAQYKKEHPNE